jgi:hypothetical protein
MWNHSLRSAIVLLLLLGTLALAVPYVSGVIDAWLFAESPQPPSSKWKAKGTDAPKTSPRPKQAARSTSRPLAYEPESDPEESPFAFDFQDEPTRAVRRDHVKAIEHTEPVEKRDSLAELQRQIQELGAAFLTVEHDGDRYECRSLFPISPDSSYQKAFSAVGTTPEAAMQQVLAEAKNWKRAAAARQR